jgi:hypothetical protein
LRALAPKGGEHSGHVVCHRIKLFGLLCGWMALSHTGGRT